MPTEVEPLIQFEPAAPKCRGRFLNLPPWMLMYFVVCLHFASETRKYAKVNEVHPNKTHYYHL